VTSTILARSRSLHLLSSASGSDAQSWNRFAKYLVNAEIGKVESTKGLYR
jgi:hypothetical protein